MIFRDTVYLPTNLADSGHLGAWVLKMKFHLLKATKSFLWTTIQKTQLSWLVTFLKVGRGFIVLKHLVAHFASKGHFVKLLLGNKWGWPSFTYLTAGWTFLSYSKPGFKAILAKQSFATLLPSAANSVPDDILANHADKVIFGFIS